VMRAGEIEQIGSPMEIYANPVSYFVADFFGSPSMNLVSGEVAHEAGALRFRAAAFDIALPERFKDAAAGRATLGTRPEHVRVRPGDEGAIKLPLRLVEPLGKDTLLYFDDGTERAFVAVTEGLAIAEELKAGARVSLDFDPRRLYLFDEDGRRIAAGL
jgi:ABC-type sugar transport system ATPase subunit